jgi:hypothetical protein
VHGSKDRVKDASPEHRQRSLVLMLGAYALMRVGRRIVPLLGDLRTSAVAGELARNGGDHHALADRPRPPFRRNSAKSAAFQKTGMPFTVTTREGMIAKGLLPPAFAPALSLTPPTRSPQGERCS